MLTLTTSVSNATFDSTRSVSTTARSRTRVDLPEVGEIAASPSWTRTDAGG